MRTVYLAGFEVFHRETIKWGELKKSFCKEQGWLGLYPCDNLAPGHLSKIEQAKWIYDKNIEMILKADAVIANLNNFRGQEPDSGTVFEVGFAVAHEKPVVGYMQDHRDLRKQLGFDVDNLNYTVEDFGLQRNLMLACAVPIVTGSFVDALRRLSLLVES